MKVINVNSLHSHTIFYTDRSYPLPSCPFMNKCLYVIILALTKIKLCGHAMRKCPFCRYNPITQNVFEMENKTCLLFS